MQKSINNPLVTFKFLIYNFDRYQKFFTKDIFRMLPSVMPEDTSGVRINIEELRLLFESFRKEYKSFPLNYTIELEEVLSKLRLEKTVIELSEDNLKEYFSIDLLRYDQNILSEHTNDWFKFCWMVNTGMNAFQNTKAKIELKSKISELEKGLSDALSIDLVQDSRLEGDLFDMDSYDDSEISTLRTGFQSLDLMLSSSGKVADGGFVRGGLYVFMTGPKGGKSLVLSNLMVKAIKMGHNIAIASFEMPKSDYFERVNCNLYGISRRHYSASTMRTVLESKNPNYGKAFFRQFTNAHTPADIELWAKKLQTQHGCKLDLVFVDYINIMSNARSAKSDNTYASVKQIAEDLRSSGLRNDWVTVSVTQTNRGAEGATDYTLSDVSESHALGATVDALFGIIKQPNIPDQRKITCIASRRTGDIEPIYFNVDWSQWRLREIARFEEQNMGLNGSYDVNNLF